MIPPDGLGRAYPFEDTLAAFSLQPGRRWLSATTALVFVVVLTLFWWHAAPGVTYHDSGEFALAAATAGIPHPPGAPTWTMLASGFIRLGGFDDPARGTNLFSGLCGALTLALLCLLVQIWSAELFPGLGRGVGFAAGLSSVLILLHSPSFLEQCLITEQYTLMTALLVAMLLLATGLARRMPRAFADVRPSPPPKSAVVLVLAVGLLWGLAVGNHLSQIALGLLAALVLFAASGRRWPVLLRLSLWTGGGFILGLLVFLWVPLRSLTDPLMDWGAVKSWDRFVWAITRRQWASRTLAEAPDGFTAAWLASYRFTDELGWAGAFAALAGLGVLAARRSPWLLWIGAATVPYALGMLFGHLRQYGMNITYIRQYGIGDWHLPLYLGGAAAAGIAIAAMSRALGVWRPAGLEPRAWRARAVLVSLLLLLAATAGQAIDNASLRDLRDPDRFIHAMLDPLPDDAIVLLSTDNPSHMLAYHRWVRQPGSRRWIVYDFPSLPAQLHKAARAGEPWTMDRQIDYLTRVVVDPTVQPLRVPALTPDEIRARPVFTEFRSIHDGAWPYLEPCGMLYRVHTRRLANDEVRAAEQHWRARWPDLPRTVPVDAPLRVREAWAGPCGDRGVYFFKRGMWTESIEYFERFVRMIRDNALVWFYYGYSLQETGKPKEAARAYQTAIEIAPGLPGPRVNLAGLLAGSGHFDLAEKLLLEELALDPDSLEVKTNLDRLRRDRAAALAAR
jgi:tetratricopeptide (TPR) repeat protein